MRSVRVVFPESMCALMPMLRARGSMPSETVAAAAVMTRRTKGAFCRCVWCTPHRGVASAADRVVWGCRCIKPYQGPGPFTAQCTTQWTSSPCAYTLQGRGCPLIVVQWTSTGIGSPPWTVPSAEAHTVQEQPRCAQSSMQASARVHPCSGYAARSPTQHAGHGARY